LDYAGLAQLCARSPIMRKIMRAHNRIIQRSLLYNSKLACFYCLFQSVTGAMNTINPPVSLSNSDNEHRVEYIQNVASQPDYEITEVGILSFYSFVCCFFFSGNVCFCDIVMAAVWSAFLAYLSCRQRTIWEIRFFMFA